MRDSEHDTNNITMYDMYLLDYMMLGKLIIEQPFYGNALYIINLKLHVSACMISTF